MARARLSIMFEDSLPTVRVFPIRNLDLEYTSEEGNTTPEIKDRPRLREEMVNVRNLKIDVMDGYNPMYDSFLNLHSIYHLYEFESKTRFLDHFSVSPFASSEMKTRFLLCRYVICAIDDSMQMKKPIELLAIRLNGDIYIGANKSMMTTPADRNSSAYGGLNFAKKVTEEVNPSFKKHHSVVKELRLENTSNIFNKTAMTIFISSVVRAFDEKGNVIELKTVKSNVAGKIQNLPAHKARNWWLRALLSGADRIVYGLRRPDMVVREVLESNLEEFTNGHFHFDGTTLFAYVFSLFQKIDKILALDNEICLVNTRGGEPEIKLTTREALKRSPFW